MKKIGSCFLAMVVLTFFSAGLAQAADRPTTEIYCLSSNVGTSAYLVSSALENLSKKHHPWLKIKHSDSPGLVYDVKKLDKDPSLKKNTFISVTLGLDWLAQRGLKPFNKKHEGVKMIGNYNMGATWLATLDPKIKTGKDLVGKKIALGRTTQVIWGCEADWLIHLGWGIRDKAKIQYVGNKDAPKALLDGLVDAAIIGGYIDPIQWQFIPGPPTLELLASGRTVYHIPWGEEAVRKTGTELTNIGSVTGEKDIVSVSEEGKKILNNLGYEHFKPVDF